MEVWPPGAIKFATLQHPALALAILCCWSSLCYCSGRALAPGCQAPCAPCCPVGPASQLISPQFPGRRCCCCQLVSHGTGESGCRIPGAQEGRSQDTQCLQQRLSEANIKGGAGAAGLGTAQLRAAGNMHTCISQGRGGRREDSWLPTALSFPLSRLGAQERSLGWSTGEAGGYTALL